MSALLIEHGTTGRWNADERGFSLTELIVVMAIFLTVMLITANTFKTIANQTSQQSKSLETQIEGIVGLEVLRADLEMAGFGLPWTFQNTPAVTEYTETIAVNTVPAAFWPSGMSPQSFNDAPANAPRAIQSGETTFNKGADDQGSKYLVIKSVVAATNDAAKKWTNVSYTAGSKTERFWGNAARNFAGTDRVIVVKNNLNTTPASRQLMVTAATGNFHVPYSNYTTLIQPHLDGDTFQVYGVADSTAAALRMPFNRADYYVKTPTDMPSGCAPHTGVLYKSNITHSGGGLNPNIPLLDCVADMQIVYGLDTDGSGTVNLHGVTAPATASDQRAQVRELRVYILAQDGTRDITFSYPSQYVDVGESFDGGATLVGRKFDLKAMIGDVYKNYRWKVYTIIVRPKNLIQ